MHVLRIPCCRPQDHTKQLSSNLYRKELPYHGCYIITQENFVSAIFISRHDTLFIWINFMPYLEGVFIYYVRLNLEIQFYVVHMKRRVLGSRFYFSYSDGQVENKCHGETGPLSAYKWSFQNTHQMSWRNALVQGKREKLFSVLCWIKFLQYVAGTEVSRIQSEAVKMEKGITNCYCLYSAVYLLLIHRKVSDP